MTRTEPLGMDEGRLAALDSVNDVAVGDTTPANVVLTLLLKMKVVMFLG